MSRLFAVVINDPQRLACAVYPTRETLIARSAPEGWGLASYQGGEVLLQRHPKPLAQPLDFFQRLRDLRTDYVVGHVSDPGTKAKLENTQPFRFRAWVYAQSGGNSALAGARAAILEHVPDFLRRNIRAQSGAEHLFHVVLAFLHDAGKLDDPNLKLQDAAGALRGALLLAQRLMGEKREDTAMNVVLTNGRILLAARNGKPLWVRQVSGIADCRLCGETLPDEMKRDRRRTNHEHVRAVIIASEPEKLPTEGWEEAADATIVGVTRDLVKTSLSLAGE